MPRSTIQIDPRSALGMGSLFGVQSAEQLVGHRDERRLRYVPLSGWQYSAEDLDGSSVLVGFREGVEGFQ